MTKTREGAGVDRAGVLADDAERICERCGGEGHIFGGHPNDPHPRHVGKCEGCGSSGWIEAAPPSSAVAGDHLEIQF